MGRSVAHRATLKRIKSSIATTSPTLDQLRQKLLDRTALLGPVQLAKARHVAPALIPAKALDGRRLRGLARLQASRIASVACTSTAVPSLVFKRDPSLPPSRGIGPGSNLRNTILRTLRRARNVARPRFLSQGSQSIADFHKLLDEDLTLFAVDTEFETHGMVQRVVEIGVTTLRTEDIRDVAPGAHMSSWLSRAKHYHIVVDITRRPRMRMAGSRFGESVFMDARNAKIALLDIIRSCTNKNGERNLALVGHSLIADLGALLFCPGFQLDLTNPGIDDLDIRAQFDTFEMAGEARRSGAVLPSLRLGELVRDLGGVAPQYHVRERSRPTLLGTHNASNDAAYTMMGALALVTKWNEIVQPKQPLLDTTQRPMQLVLKQSTLHASSQQSWLQWATRIVSRILP